MTGISSLPAAFVKVKLILDIKDMPHQLKVWKYGAKDL
jgi:hypothetical protein